MAHIRKEQESDRRCKSEWEKIFPIGITNSGIRKLPEVLQAVRDVFESIFYVLSEDDGEMSPKLKELRFSIDSIDAKVSLSANNRDDNDNNDDDDDVDDETRYRIKYNLDIIADKEILEELAKIERFRDNAIIYDITEEDAIAMIRG